LVGGFQVVSNEEWKTEIINLRQHAISSCHTANPQLGERVVIKSMDSASVSAVCETPGF
jgi:hypothetical protein